MFGRTVWNSAYRAAEIVFLLLGNQFGAGREVEKFLNPLCPPARWWRDAAFPVADRCGRNLIILSQGRSEVCLAFQRELLFDCS